MPRLSWLRAVIVLFALLSGGDALAQSRPPPQRPAPVQSVSSRVKVEMLVVQASNKCDRVDAALQPVLKHVRHLDFSCYQLLEQHAPMLALGQETTFSIAGSKLKAKVKLIDKNDEAARIQIRLQRGDTKVMEVTAQVNRDRFFVVGGPNHDGGRLIIPITVKY